MNYSLSVHQKFVLSILRYRKFSLIAKIMVIAIMFSVGLNYYQLIAHLFQKEDLTNQAIAQAVTSEEYKSTVWPMFNLVQEYNNGYSNIKPSQDFYANIPTLLNATIVHIHGRLISIPPQNNITSDIKGRGSFKYDLEYSITLSQYMLSIFLIIETGLFLILIYMNHCKKSSQEIDFEEKVVSHYFEKLITPITSKADIQSETEQLKNILKRFTSFHTNLNKRYNSRTGFVINDEYDVQDLLHSILSLHFQDVHRESGIPYKTGANSRIDFLIRDKSIGLEVKMTRKGLRDKELGDQIIVDIHRYSSHQNCKDVVFFVYDPEFLIINVDGLRSDVEKLNSDIIPHLIVVPER